MFLTFIWHHVSFILPSRRVIKKVSEKVVAVGKMESVTLESMDTNVSLKLEEMFSDGEMYQYRHLLVESQMIHSQSYQRVSQRNSFTVRYVEHNEDCFCQII